MNRLLFIIVTLLCIPALTQTKPANQTTLDALDDISAEPDARSLSEEQRIEREKSEAARLNREFARHIVRVLDAL
jgi:hypothetical protein